MNNDSPWLHQLKITRPIDKLHDSMATDIAIVGAGIAGVMTAYHILKETDKSVVLIEGNRVAHGATGHNAGQIVFEFEKPLHALVEEYGLAMATDAEKLVRSAWLILEEIYQTANLSTPMSSFMGYNGYSHLPAVIEELRNNALRMEAGIAVTPMYIADSTADLSTIPHQYKDLYILVPHEDILSLLETNSKRYIAVSSERKGCVNSAMLVEEIVGYLLATYKARFVLAEETFINEVVLEKNKATLHTKDHVVTASKVVLCTNGFEKFKITSKVGADIDTKFHHMVSADVGYMAGYLEELKHPPIALQFIDKKEETAEDVPAIKQPFYFYMTRRPYEIEKNERHNLVCVGGPEHIIEDSSQYSEDEAYKEGAAEDIENFLHKTYKHAPKEPIHFKFKWHGLMGYTPTSIRVVGEEPKNRVLMYNLGCNGVGILTSIYGGKRIAEIISGKTLAPSLFDPRAEYEETK